MTKTLLTTLTLLGLSLSVPHSAQAQSWLNQIGGKGADVPTDVVETSDRRLCATGTFWSKAVFGEGDNKITLSTKEAQDIFVACYTATGELEFAKQLGGRRGDEPRALAALPDGELVVTGLFSRKLGLAPTSTLETNGNSDIFVTRLDKQGEVVWSKQFGGKLADSPSAMSVTKQGDIIVAGSFENLLNFPQGDKLSKINSAGARDAMVMKLDINGEVQWMQRFGGTGYDNAAAIAPGTNDNLIIAGTFQNSMKIDQAELLSRGFKDVFVASLSSAGQLQWIQQIGGKAQDNVTAVAVDSSGRVHVAGDFQKSMAVSSKYKLVSAGSADIYVARFSAAGELELAQSLGGKYIDQVFAIATTSENGLLLAGHYQGRSDMAPGPDVAMLQSPTIANSNGFLVLLDKDGAHSHSQALGGDGVEMALGLESLEGGDVAVIGLFNNNFNVDTMPALKVRGKTDVFLTRIRASENVQVKVSQVIAD